MTNRNPTEPVRPWWSSDAEDREIDLFLSGKLPESEDRSLDRLIAARRSDRTDAKRPKRRGPRNTEK